MYNQEKINQIKQDYFKIYSKHQKLILLSFFISENLKNNDAKEYILHGVARRIKTIYKCIENIFNLLPIDECSLYKEDKIADATINLHAFYINIAGLLDNFALVIWLEKKPLEGVENNKNVGFDKKCFRKSLSNKFQEYLEKNSLWLEYIKNYRDALAHRIPLYIPPLIDEKTGKEIQSISIKHSIFKKEEIKDDENNLFIFHTQLIEDFNKIEEFFYKFRNDFSFGKNFMEEWQKKESFAQNIPHPKYFP